MTLECALRAALRLPRPAAVSPSRAAACLAQQRGCATAAAQSLPQLPPSPILNPPSHTPLTTTPHTHTRTHTPLPPQKRSSSAPTRCTRATTGTRARTRTPARASCAARRRRTSRSSAPRRAARAAGGARARTRTTCLSTGCTRAASRRSRAPTARGAGFFVGWGGALFVCCFFGGGPGAAEGGWL